jgi:hypothetical protein
LGGKYVFEAQDNPFFLRNYEFQKSSKKNLKYEVPETVGRIRDHLEGKAQKTIFFMKLLVAHGELRFRKEKKRKFVLTFLSFSFGIAHIHSGHKLLPSEMFLAPKKQHLRM